MKIMIALDSSTSAEAVINQVMHKGWPDGSSFELVTVIENCHVYDLEQQLLRQTQMLLRDRAESLKKKFGDENVSTAILQGSPIEMLLDYMRKNQPDLVVIGSHGDTGKRKAKSSSIAAQIANCAPCSVDIIKIAKQARERIKTRT